MKFNVKAYDGVNVEIKCSGAEIMFIEADISFPEKQIPKMVSIEWVMPAEGMFSHLNINVLDENNRSLGYDWKNRITKSRFGTGAPVHGIIGADNNNKLNISLLDAATPIEIKTGIVEEDVTMMCKVQFFTLPVAPIKEYHTTIRIDTRDIPFYDVYYDVGKWWEENGLPCTYIPETAKLPMYSTWYSFHQNILPEEILKQCKTAKELGMETVIVDDGWQTDNLERGYAYCGDWEPNPSKIPDMKAFVDAVHNLGMKFILWYAVPFVGKYSGLSYKFKDKFLHYSEENEMGELDPRYPDVRKHISDTYVHAVKDWGLDGFKLDFIDSFLLSEMSMNYDPGRDIESLEDAVEVLIDEIVTRLKKINPEILIEFRQQYMGPKIRKFGNMMRAGDCAADPIMNRCRTITLRLTSGDMAVHSDMVEWSVNDTAENAARQLYNTIFSVPQISLRFDELSREHMKTLKFYLDFWRSNRDVLLNGKMCAFAPQSNFIKAYSEKEDKIIIALYEDKVAEIAKSYSDIKIINAGTEDYIIIDAKISEKMDYRIYNCMGDICGSGAVELDGLIKMPMPVSGILELF